jgi:RNA-directed DNA polymerase
MKPKTFQDLFQLYFHNKYLYQDFINTKPIIKNNIIENIYNSHTTYSYNLKNKDSLKLKNYHTFLNNLIFSKQSIHSCVYSYRENHTILQMLILHKNNKYFFKTDIKNFFGSITKNMILKYIKFNISNTPIDNILELITINNKLPAGFVSSPNISNTVLYEFDTAINKYCKEQNIIYSRYSDDLVFSSNIKFNKIEDIIQNILSSLYDGKFILNAKKSQYLDKTKRVKILGLIITPQHHITVPKKEKENIKKLIYFYINDKDKFNKFLEYKYNNNIAKAYGKLNYINDIDIKFTNYLREKYGNFVIDKFLHGDKRVG